jgi:hypothetical protein
MLSAAPKTMKEAGSAIFEELRAAYITPRKLQSEKVPQHSMFRVRQRVLHLHTKLRNTILVEKLIKIFQSLWDLKFSHSVHNKSSPNPALSYLNPVTHIFKMRLHFYPLRSRTSDIPRGPFPFQNFRPNSCMYETPDESWPPNFVIGRESNKFSPQTSGYQTVGRAKLSVVEQILITGNLNISN